MKCLIITYNRLTLPVNLANWVYKRGITPIFIDNNSSYRPLLEYYKKDCPYQVLRLKYNYGHRVIWDANILDKLNIKGQYIITDPDLDLSGIPDDFLEVLQGGLNKYKKAEKCGFSLDISNLPEGKIKEWESSLWQHPLDDMYFKAGIDTTFALYRANIRHYTIWDSIRTNRPYTAIHVPWSYRQENIKYLDSDEKYYIRTANKSASSFQNLNIKK